MSYNAAAGAHIRRQPGSGADNVKCAFAIADAAEEQRAHQPPARSIRHARREEHGIGQQDQCGGVHPYPLDVILAPAFGEHDKTPRAPQPPK